jgi:hypothetical protein
MLLFVGAMKGCAFIFLKEAKRNRLFFSYFAYIARHMFIGTESVSCIGSKLANSYF